MGNSLTATPPSDFQNTLQKYIKENENKKPNHSSEAVGDKEETGYHVLKAQNAQSSIAPTGKLCLGSAKRKKHPPSRSSSIGSLRDLNAEDVEDKIYWRTVKNRKNLVIQERQENEAFRRRREQEKANQILFHRRSRTQKERIQDEEYNEFIRHKIQILADRKSGQWGGAPQSLRSTRQSTQMMPIASNASATTQNTGGQSVTCSNPNCLICSAHLLLAHQPKFEDSEEREIQKSQYQTVKEGESGSVEADADGSTTRKQSTVEQSSEGKYISQKMRCRNRFGQFVHHDSPDAIAQKSSVGVTRKVLKSNKDAANPNQKWKFDGIEYETPSVQKIQDYVPYNRGITLSFLVNYTGGLWDGLTAFDEESEASRMAEVGCVSQHQMRKMRYAKRLERQQMVDFLDSFDKSTQAPNQDQVVEAQQLQSNLVKNQPVTKNKPVSYSSKQTLEKLKVERSRQMLHNQEIKRPTANALSEQQRHTEITASAAGSAGKEQTIKLMMNEQYQHCGNCLTANEINPKTPHKDVDSRSGGRPQDQPIQKFYFHDTKENIPNNSSPNDNGGILSAPFVTKQNAENLGEVSDDCRTEVANPVAEPKEYVFKSESLKTTTNVIHEFAVASKNLSTAVKKNEDSHCEDLCRAQILLDQSGPAKNNLHKDNPASARFFVSTINKKTGLSTEAENHKRNNAIDPKNLRTLKRLKRKSSDDIEDNSKIQPPHLYHAEQAASPISSAPVRKSARIQSLGPRRVYGEDVLIDDYLDSVIQTSSRLKNGISANHESSYSEEDLGISDEEVNTVVWCDTGSPCYQSEDGSCSKIIGQETYETAQSKIRMLPGRIHRRRKVENSRHRKDILLASDEEKDVYCQEEDDFSHEVNSELIPLQIDSFPLKSDHRQKWNEEKTAFAPGLSSSMPGSALTESVSIGTPCESPDGQHQKKKLTEEAEQEVVEHIWRSMRCFNQRERSSDSGELGALEKLKAVPVFCWGEDATGRHVQLKGKLTRGTVKCDCCQQNHGLMAFLEHAGNSSRKPYADIFMMKERVSIGAFLS